MEPPPVAARRYWLEALIGINAAGALAMAPLMPARMSGISSPSVMRLDAAGHPDLWGAPSVLWRVAAMSLFITIMSLPSKSCSKQRGRANRSYCAPPRNADRATVAFHDEWERLKDQQIAGHLLLLYHDDEWRMPLREPLGAAGDITKHLDEERHHSF